MTDASIIDLYFRRSDAAIRETDRAYGKFCYAVAFGILNNREDSDESVNDTWLAAWNAMPPSRPNSLKAFLGKLTRRISIMRLRKNTAAKRGGGEAELAIEELAECIPSSVNTAREIELLELTQSVNACLRSMTKRERDLFVARYWYSLPVKELADRFELTESNVKQILHRTREKLQRHLQEEGLC